MNSADILMRFLETKCKDIDTIANILDYVANTILCISKNDKKLNSNLEYLINNLEPHTKKLLFAMSTIYCKEVIGNFYIDEKEANA